MIVKLAHITACSRDLDNDITNLVQQSYKIDFIEKNLENLLIKKKSFDTIL